MSCASQRDDADPAGSATSITSESSRPSAGTDLVAAPQTSVEDLPTTTAAVLTTTTAPTTTTSPTTTTTTVPAPVGPVACPPTGSSIWEVRAASDIAPPELPAEWTTEVIGASVQGRDLVALARAIDEPERRVVVIGGLHGNEPVSPPTVRGLVEATVPSDVGVWLVPEANPDGMAAGMRCNANGVDLNRNFSWGWRADDGGSSPLSEPEPQALVALIEQVQPDVVVWVHQPYGYVSSIGPTDSALEEAWASASEVPVRPDVTQHGGGESWTAFVDGTPSMLIEIDSWSATVETVERHRAGFEAMVAALG